MIKDILKNFIVVFLGGNFESLVRFTLHILIAKLLGPRYYGHYVLMMAVIGYARITNLGFIDGMRRQVPYYQGAGAESNVNSVKSQAFWTAVIIPSLIVTLGYSFFHEALWGLMTPPDSSLHGAWIMTMAIIVVSSGFSYIPGVAVASKRFKDAVIYRNCLAILTLLLAVPGIHFFGLTGAMGAWLVSYAFNMLWGLIKERTPELRFNLKEIKKLLGIGLPLMMTDIIGGLYYNIDKFLIGAFLGTTYVGFYGIGVLMIDFLHSLPGMLAGVLYPDMASRFGKKDDPQDVYSLWWRPVMSLSIVIPFFLPFLYFGVDLFFHQVMTQYLPGLAATKILILGVFFYMLTPISSSTMISIGKQIFSMYLTMTNLALAVLLILLVIKLGFGISGVALATALVFFFDHLIRIVMLMRWMSVPPRDFLRNILVLDLGFFVMVSLIMMSEFLGDHFGNAVYTKVAMLILIEIILFNFLKNFRPYKKELKNLIQKFKLIF